MHSGFLNVDLEIESRATLESLAAEMSDRVVVLYCGAAGNRNRHLLAIEIVEQSSGPDMTIHQLCSIIEGLSPAGQRLWKRAVRKEFDLGYESRPSKRSVRFMLRQDTLQRIASLGATLAVTCYRR